MGPIAKEAADAYKDKGVQFVTFDFTTDETTAAAVEAAGKLNVKKIYDDHAPKTGYCLLVNAESGEVVTRLSAKNDIAEWKSTIDEALAGG